MSKKVIVEAVIGVVLLALLVTGVVGVQAYRRPLGEPLSLVLQATSTPDAASQAAGTATPQAAAAGKTCGLSGTMTVLMIGRDEKYWEPPYGADAIRMVKIDFSAKTVSVFAFQRDLQVETPSLEKKYGIKEYKLGPTYVLVSDKEGKDAPGRDIKATNEIAQILYDNFGITPDHYMTIEEGVLPWMVDQVGGVNVNLTDPVQFVDLKLPAGEQVLDGRKAMLYSRYLKDGKTSVDEWGRFNRQAVVFKALAVKLLEPANFLKIPDFIKEANKSVVTDLSPEQIRSLACMAKEIPLTSVTMKTIESNQLNILADETMVIKDIDAVRKTLADIFGTGK